MLNGVLIALISGIISAFAQVLLKKGATIEHSSFFKDYLNLYVLTGYGLTFCCMILMIIAYRTLPFKFGAVLESIVYFYVMLLSKIFFNERITNKKIAGTVLIIIGVIIFSI